ncbi:MAG: hypothetical protein ACREHD_28340 [Pirellulales bacterium]
MCTVACYAGLAPLFRLARRREDPFFDLHAAQAAIFWLLLDVTIFLSLAYLAGVSAMIVYARGIYERLPNVSGLAPPERDGIPVTAAVLVWLAAVAAAAVLAAFGQQRSWPIVGRLARRPRVLRLAWVANTVSLLLAALILVAALHASTFTRDDERPANVYVLYDDMGGIPRWVMNLGFYRLSTAATERWGPESVVVAHLDAPHLRSALENGQVVFLACHGADGEILARSLTVIPASAAASLPDQPQKGVLAITKRGRERLCDWIEPGANLRFVYNAACDGGRKQDAWRASFAPVEVKTFDRLSLVVEHWHWVWFTAPRLIRGGKWSNP